MRQPLSAIALVLGTLVGAPAFGAEVLESVLEVSFQYAGDSVVRTDGVVPLLPGNACYNWYIRLGGDPPKAATEILTLPIALDDWGDLATDPDDGIDISADGKVATRSFVPDQDTDGWFTHGWCVAAGDPIGAHMIEVAVDGETIATYDFQTVLPEDYSWPSISQPVLRERSVDNSW
jgi:hypothetical protein